MFNVQRSASLQFLGFLDLVKEIALPQPRSTRCSNILRPLKETAGLLRSTTCLHSSPSASSSLTSRLQIPINNSTWGSSLCLLSLYALLSSGVADDNAPRNGLLPFIVRRCSSAIVRDGRGDFPSSIDLCAQLKGFPSCIHVSYFSGPTPQLYIWLPFF